MAFQEGGSAAGAAKLVEAINALINTLISHYGSAGTLFIILGAVALAIVWRLFSDWVKNRRVDRALAEKEASIKRLAGEVRMYRAIFLKEKAGWNEDLINQLLLSDTIEASQPPKRRALLGKLLGRRRSSND